MARDFPDLPAWICQGGGRHDDALGRCLAPLPGKRVQGAGPTFGDIAGANLIDWPITLAELEPYYARAEDKMGVTRTQGIPGLPGNNNFKVMYTGAKRLGYKEVHTGHMAINSVETTSDGLPADRFLLPGLQVGREVVHRSIPRSRAAKTPANWKSASECHASRSSTTTAARSTASSSLDKDGNEQRQRRASFASRAIRSRVRACS